MQSKERHSAVTHASFHLSPGNLTDRAHWNPGSLPETLGLQSELTLAETPNGAVSIQNSLSFPKVQVALPTAKNPQYLLAAGLYGGLVYGTLIPADATAEEVPAQSIKRN